jgi:two-component system phosphate regulon response regulator PhoB
MTPRPQILVIEDEKDVRDLILLHLKRESYEASHVEDGEEALKHLQQRDYDMIILDWMLPGLSGLEICKRIKGKAPILMVTARADTSDIVLGLEMGADDYITKPFEISIFLARVRALLRRGQTESQNSSSERIQVGNLHVDFEAHRVLCGSDEVQLTPSEFKLLAALVKNRGRVLSREKLIELVQGQGVAVIDRAVDTHIFGLRKKLGACAEIIETIRGVGYRVES